MLYFITCKKFVHENYEGLQQQRTKLFLFIVYKNMRRVVVKLFPYVICLFVLNCF